MTSPTVTESPAALEPVSTDPFLDGLGGTSPAQPTSAHAPAAGRPRVSSRLTRRARLSTVVIAVVIAVGAIGAGPGAASLVARQPAPAPVRFASPPDPIPI